MGLDGLIATMKTTDEILLDEIQKYVESATAPKRYAVFKPGSFELIATDDPPFGSDSRIFELIPASESHRYES